ncbi:MAG: hypothetical protein IJ363_12815 [Clostridia bacterium]|nr:hypothetical protein [Clostridia bacterium]
MNTTDRPTVRGERVGMGVLGAILFSLAGAVVYYVLWSVNIIAAISGIICVICALKGYEILAGARTKRGIFISVAVSAVMLVLVWYFCYCSDIHAYWESAFAAGETDYVPTVWECLSYGYMDLPANPGYLVDLLLSLAMGGLGCWGYVTRSLRMEEEAAARRAEQERTAELARLQAEQAARAAELNGERDPSAPAPEDTEASDSEAADPSDTSSSAPSDTEEP